MDASGGEVLQPGIVLIRDRLSLADQQTWVDRVYALADGKTEGIDGSLFGDDGGLNMKTKGRLIISMDSFPSDLRKWEAQLMEEARALDPTLPACTARLLTLTYYKSKKGALGWHRDRVEGRADDDHADVADPVLSISLGEPGDFSWKMTTDGEERKVTLRSGDVLVFGGPSRMIWHKVDNVHRGDTPEGLRMPISGRLNLTFRETSHPGYIPNAT